MLALVAATLVGSTPQRADAETLCVLAPVLRDTNVSQGIGTTSSASGYQNLRRGKSTIVRASLSKPQCATSDDRIQLTSATLEVVFPGRSGSGEVPNTVTGPVFPELLDYAAAPAPNAAGDPVFTVPGALLDGTTTDRATASFTITVNYQATSALGIPSTGVLTLRPNGALTGPTVKATFERPSNSPRLLIVPMGDPTKGFAANWPARTAEDEADGADDVLLRALQAASRQSPFKDAVAEDLLSAAGIRYALAPTVLDVSDAIRIEDGKFCGTGENFSYVRSQLASFLNNWQTANAGTIVDKVLGVVWGPNSTGPKTDSKCADGYAAIGGNQAWTRLEPDIDGAATNAGNLIVMETVGHNFGSVPSTRDASGNAYHSVATADAGTRGINTSTGQPISDAVSPLKYALTGWDDYRTLLRREDWAYTLCRLTPATTDVCPVEQVDLNSNTTPIGAPAGLAASVYTIAGTTDGTSEGTEFDTYLAPPNDDGGTDLSDPSKTSDYRLVQRGVDATGEPVLATTFFQVDVLTSEHHNGGVHEHGTSTRGTAEVRFAAVDGAQIFEVYKGDPKKSAPIYRRQRDDVLLLAGTGTVTPAPGPLVNETAGAAGGGDVPTLSPDGTKLAYTSVDGLVVKNLATGVTGAATSGDAASWIDDDTLAFEDDGNLYVGNVDDSLGIPERDIVYDASKQVDLFFAPAGRPTVQGNVLITAIGKSDRDLWRINITEALLSPSGVTCSLAAGSLAPCYRVTSGGTDDRDPTFAPTAENTQRVLFVRDELLQVLDLSNEPQVSPSELPGAQPSASDDFVAYRTNTGLALADSQLSQVNDVLTEGSDGWPSLRGRSLAFARTEGERTDVYTGRLQSNVLTFSATDNAPARLRAGVYATCGALSYPIFVAVPPSSVGDNVATWSLEWDAAGSTCTQPLLHALVNDGIDTARVELGTAYGPEQPRNARVGAIYAPAPGTTVLQYDAPSLLGDVPGAPPEKLSWRVTGPDYDETFPFTRGTPTLAMPPTAGCVDVDQPTPACGWQDGGVYGVRLLHGEEVLASGTFRAVGDEDHDNISKPVEVRCFGPEADLDPSNAGVDSDGDGYVNVADADPCTSATNVTVDLDANSLNTSSKGTNVTIYLRDSAVDLRAVPMSAIAATRIGNYDADLRATAYENVTATSATVKISRQELHDFVEARGLTGYVPVILTGVGTTGSFSGLDPTDPRFF